MDFLITKNFHNVLLKIFLLEQLHQLFCDLFKDKMMCNRNHHMMESYDMDNQIIQNLIQEIIDTDAYTLEGIAYYTRIPFDVIYDAARGNNKQYSFTLWIKIINLYMQVKPETVQLLINKLVQIKENKIDLTVLLREP